MRSPLENESTPGNCSVNVYENSHELASQCTMWSNEWSCGPVASSTNMRKQVRVTEYSFLLAHWCESQFNKYFIGVPSMHTVVFQPTSLTTGIYWPPSTAKVLYIPKF